MAKQRDLCVNGRSPGFTHCLFCHHFSCWNCIYIHIYWSKHFLLKTSKLCGIFIIGDLNIWTTFFLFSLCSTFCLFWMGTAERWVWLTLLGILPDGYSVWIRSKSQPKPQCVCWTVQCISGDHTGSISTFKSLCCPLSLSQHLPVGWGSGVQ